MKKLSIAALLFAASLSAADFSGIWNGKGGFPDPKYGTVPQTSQMTLLQAGTSLSGTIKLGSTGKIVKITSGSVNGTQVSIVAADGNTQITGQLTSSGNQLQGRITTSNGKVFIVTYTKQ